MERYCSKCNAKMNENELTCPECGHEEIEVEPLDTINVPKRGKFLATKGSKRVLLFIVIALIIIGASYLIIQTNFR